MFDRAHDARVRTATFDWLKARVSELGDVLARKLLAQGFDYRGNRVPLLGPQGIFNPAVLDVPLEGVRARRDRRRYITTQARRRVHQQAFREQVLRAYQRQCALCHLKHDELPLSLSPSARKSGRGAMGAP